MTPACGHASVRRAQLTLRIFKQRHESEIHVQLLLVAVKQAWVLDLRPLRSRFPMLIIGQPAILELRMYP
jgi:hypothetical protein